MRSIRIVDAACPRCALHQIGRHTSTLVLIESQIARATRVIEHTVVSTRVKELTIGSILVEIDAVRFACTLRHHLAQRRVLVREVLTRREALFAYAAFHARIVETLFCVHVKEKRILTQLRHETTVHALVVTTTAFRVHETISLLE